MEYRVLTQSSKTHYSVPPPRPHLFITIFRLRLQPKPVEVKM